MTLPSLTRPAAVLFDLDGTLLDSAPDLAAAANAMRTARHLDALPLQHYRPFIGTGARGMLRLALHVEENHADFATLREEFFQAYEQCMGQQAQLFTGVEQLLATLQAQHIPWGIVTNKISRFAQPIVQHCPVLSQTQTLVCGDSTPHTKPHPAPLLTAAQQLGVSPSTCVYVGDDERDILAARAAGMTAVAASYGYTGNAQNVQEWGPDAVADTPVSLLKTLDLH
jgi:2-phosphoglycolate phosphatase